MRTKYQTKLAVLSVMTVILFVFTNCSPVQVREVIIQRADHYKFSSEKSGLKISVDPYREERRLQDFFGYNLLSRGILPVLVVIENQTAQDGYTLVTDKSGLLISKTEERKIANTLTEQNLNSPPPTMPVLPFVILIPIGIAVQMSTTQQLVNENQIRNNLEQKRMLDKTLYQGGSQSGFLYFKLNDKENAERVQGIRFTLKNIRTDETVVFTINISSE